MGIPNLATFPHICTHTHTHKGRTTMVRFFFCKVLAWPQIWRKMDGQAARAVGQPGETSHTFANPQHTNASTALAALRICKSMSLYCNSTSQGAQRSLLSSVPSGPMRHKVQPCPHAPMPLCPLWQMASASLCPLAPAPCLLFPAPCSFPFY